MKKLNFKPLLLVAFLATIALVTAVGTASKALDFTSCEATSSLVPHSTPSDEIDEDCHECKLDFSTPILDPNTGQQIGARYEVSSVSHTYKLVGCWYSQTDTRTCTEKGHTGGTDAACDSYGEIFGTTTSPTITGTN